MTPKELIKKHYGFDEAEFDPQTPFIKLSISDLCELLNTYASYFENQCVCHHCGDIIEHPTCPPCEMQLTMPTEEY